MRARIRRPSPNGGALSLGRAAHRTCRSCQNIRSARISSPAPSRRQGARDCRPRLQPTWARQTRRKQGTAAHLEEAAAAPPRLDHGHGIAPVHDLEHAVQGLRDQRLNPARISHWCHAPPPLAAARPARGGITFRVFSRRAAAERTRSGAATREGRACASQEHRAVRHCDTPHTRVLRAPYPA